MKKILIIILLLVACSCLAGCGYFKKEKIDTVINEVTVKRSGESDQYLIFTDNGVFVNTDSLYYWKWNSSDIQGAIMKIKGEPVSLVVYGWRVPFLSMYQNILSIKSKK